MPYSRDDGTSTPNLAGLIQLASGFRINDGTFVLTRCDLFDAAPVRPSVTSLTADHGGYPTAQFFEFRPFVVEGYLTVSQLSYVWNAKDDLKAALSLYTGLQVITLNNSGWSAARQVTARLDGANPIAFAEPIMLEKNVPDRDFVITMVAPDPRIYATTQQDVTIASGGTSVTNNGSEATPFIVKFNSSQTGPMGVTAPDGTKVEISSLGSASWIQVNTHDPATGTLTAVDNTGANVRSKVTATTARLITPGTHTWTSYNAGGAGTTHLLFRDAYS